MEGRVRDWKEVEGGESLTGMYRMEKPSIFNKRTKSNQGNGYILRSFIVVSKKFFLKKR